MRNRWELVSEENKQNVEQGTVGKCFMPERATKESAGYDLFTPVRLEIKPGETAFVWTGVKAEMKKGKVLLLDVTSGIGAKKHCMLINTIGVVDKDYHNSKATEGNIGIGLRNMKPKFDIIAGNLVDLTEENTVVFEVGEKIAQGILVDFDTFENCNKDAERVGGYGSTDKNRTEVQEVAMMGTTRKSDRLVLRHRYGTRNVSRIYKKQREEAIKREARLQKQLMYMNDHRRRS